MEHHYSIGYSCNEDPSNEKFQLHNHDEYELLLFLEGDATYVVEEKSYTLEPGDIILIRKHEMHRIYHNRPACYRRSIMMVAPEFFKENPKPIIISFDDGYKGRPVMCPPERALKLIERVGHRKLVLGHYGGHKQWKEVLDILAGQDVYFDTAFTLHEIDEKTFKDILYKHGDDRILFATED